MGRTYTYNKLWRQRNPEARNALKKRNYAKTQGGRNSRQRWSIEHIEMVLAHTIPDSELAKKIGRSVEAIQIQRTRHSSEAP